MSIGRTGQIDVASADVRCPPASAKRHVSRPVKIAYLIGSLAIGGAEGQLVELLSRLDPSRWETSLVVFNEQHAERAPAALRQVLSLGIHSGGNSRSYLKAWKTITAVTRLAGYLRSIRPDILHAFLPASFILAAPAARLARVPILVGSRRSLVNCYRTGGPRAMADRLATRWCDFVLGNSAAVTDELIHMDGVPAEHASTIYNGVDTARFRPGDRSLRQVYGWGADDVVFGIVANFIPYKRHADFVRAAALICAKSPHARFIMAGEDRGILPAIREEIVQAGLESRFVIIPGTLEPERLYPAMDAYICTSKTEGFSNVLLEAAASGLPLIATRVGGNPEIVFPGENGFLVPVSSPKEIAESALAIIDDPTLRRHMGRHSRELVERRFSLEIMVRQHELFYEKVIAAGRAGVPLLA